MKKTEFLRQMADISYYETTCYSISNLHINVNTDLKFTTNHIRQSVSKIARNAAINKFHITPEAS